MAAELYTAPWVSGTRASKYFGPVGVELFVEGDDMDEWHTAETDLLRLLEQKADELGANAVVGVEITLDPFAIRSSDDAQGLRLHAVGTAALLEKFATW